MTEKDKTNHLNHRLLLLSHPLHITTPSSTAYAWRSHAWEAHDGLLKTSEGAPSCSGICSFAQQRDRYKIDQK